MKKLTSMKNMILTVLKKIEKGLYTMLFRAMLVLAILFLFIYAAKKVWFGWLKSFIAKESKEETSHEEKDTDAKQA